MSKTESSIGAGRALILSPDEFSSELREAAERAISLSGAEGELAGALPGRGEWDTRLLLARAGQLYLLRCTDPALAEEYDKFEVLLLLYERLGRFGDSVPIAGQTIAGGRLWLQRKFFNQVPPGAAGRGRGPREAFTDLLHGVAALHQGGIVHGHLAPSNIAYESGRLLILDLGLCIFSRMSSADLATLAPEVRKGEPATSATDIYGLGLVAQQFLQHESGCAEIISRMLAREPAARPSLPEIIAAVASCASAARSSPRPVSLDAAGAGAAAVKAALLRDKRLLAGIVVALLVILWRACGVPGGGSPGPAPSQLAAGDQAGYERFWESGIPSLMQQVVQAAIDREDQIARMVIVRAAFENENSAPARNDLLRVAFDPRWEAELSSSDRKVALTLALTAFVSRDAMEKLPPLSKAHPGVVLAVSATLPADTALPSLAAVPVTAMSSLPSPLGPAFQDLSRIDITKMSDVPARVLSHILVGDASPNILELYFPEEEQELKVFVKIGSLLNLMNERPDLADQLSSFISGRHRLLGALIGWFESENAANWEGLNAQQRLSIVAGVLPAREYSFEQLVDLLRFPRESIRVKAQKALVPKFFPNGLAPTLAFLSKEQNKLSRAQSIMLLSALRLGRDAQFSFLGKWFPTRPDPATIAGLLIARSNLPPNDPLNVASARYLSRENWSPDMEQLTKLAVHPEPVVRAMVYSRLRISEPQELKLLRAMADLEPDSKLKQRLEQRLKDAQ